MKRVRARLDWLERRVPTRPACPCQDPKGPVQFIVHPPRVIGQPYEETPPAPARSCDRCGRPIKDMHYVVKAPRQLELAAAEGATP